MKANDEVRKDVTQMPSTNINIRMDAELKSAFEAFCKDVGLTMTTAFNVFAKKTVDEQRIPFSIGKERPNKETLEALEEVRQMKADPTLGKTYTDVDKMMKELLS
nr:type II toxin-antitoxin system RelB/DinJ family antitoxin [uncultured Selenomonas sp.]